MWRRKRHSDTPEDREDVLTEYRTKSNSMIPLLRLPPELRNRIWEYALGGHIFTVRSCDPKSKVVHFEVSSEEKKGTTLLRACRQIYAETALLPFRLNAFMFHSESSIRWVACLSPGQQMLVSRVCLTTDDYTHFADLKSHWAICVQFVQALRSGSFPGLKEIVVRVTSRPHIIRAALNVPRFGKFLEVYTEHNVGCFRKYVREVHPTAKVDFVHKDLHIWLSTAREGTLN